MKSTSTIVNIVLAIALAVLYVLFFMNKPENAQNTISENEVKTMVSNEIAIAWVNIDSVLNNYDLYFDIQKELEDKGRKMESDLNRKTKNFEEQMIDFQEKVQKGLVTRSTAQQMQQDLAEKEQELYQYRDELRMHFAEEEQVMLRRIHHSITKFIEDYNKDKGYQVILSSSFGGPLLYGHPSIEITKDIVSGLNKEYSENKSSK